MARVFSTFNANAIGPGLVLDQGNTIVTTNLPGLDANRAVLCTLPKAVGDVFAELAFWSQSRGDMSGLCAWGLAEPDAPLDEMLGGPSGKSFAYRPSEGGIYWNGNKIDTSGTDTTPERTFIGMQVKFNFSSAGPLAIWSRGRSQLGAVYLPSGKFWCAAVSVGNGDQAAGDVSAFLRTRYPFENQPPIPAPPS